MQAHASSGSPRAIGTLLALALLAACSRGPVDLDAPPLAALDARPIRELTPLGEPRLEPLPIPAGIEPWTIEANEIHVLPPEPPAEAGEPRIELRGRELKRIRIPGPFEPAAGNRVLLQAQLFNSANFYVQLVRDGQVVIESPEVSLAFAKASQTVVLDFPHVRGESAPVDSLDVMVHGRGITRIEQVTLVQQPLEAWLPRSDEPPALVAIGLESRRARALTSETPWVTRARPVRGSILGFSYGVPRALHHPGPEPVRLLVTVTAEGREPRVVELALDDPPTSPRWRFARIQLSDFAEREVELRFELDSPDALLALCAVGELRLLAPRPGVKSVLLVTSDTHRADYLGLAERGVDVTTPHLDALADRGVWFEDCFASSNVTNPSHIALMTATHPRDTRILSNDTPLSELAPTLADRFHEAGFLTYAAVSTRHLGNDVSGLGQGFDRMSWPLINADRRANATIDIVERWLADADGLPLFVWLHAFDAHAPYEPPAEFGSLYYDATKDAFDPEAPGPGIETRLLPAFLKGLKDLDYPDAMYRGEISYLDRELARLLDKPRFREGIVAFTADHGENLGHHGIYFDHGDLYPDTIHVPLILSWPGGPQGLRSPRPVRQIDVGRSLLELAGVGDADFPGTSLADELEDAAERAPRFAVSSNFASAAMTWNGWHLMLHLRDHAERNRVEPAEKHQVELYDLRTDPACEHSVLEAEPERAKAMRLALLQWLGDSRDLGWALESRRDSALLAQLAQLGYVDDGSSGGMYEHLDPDCACAWCQRFR